ncbi:sensor histidine kinase [Anaerosporobacter sp.]|uniref:sensor histidine kinase n=1 Tax=Anaerosporobacter sp. TaxID=1872529 RepID=UPI00286F01BD|nr:sensor histidine kinase [Anaerosporobacter sp.]
MSRIKNCWTNKLKITQKISLTVFCFAFIPILILFIVIVMNLEEKEKNDKIYLVKASANQIHANVQKTVELCNMSTQAFLNNGALLTFLQQIHSGEEIFINDMIRFRRDEIVNLERLVNSNPYLYQIRVYVDDDDMLEMIPILFKTDRMKNTQIMVDNSIQSSWLFNYTDDLFQLSANPTKHIMALTTRIPNYTYGNLGYIEVAVKMEDVFPELFDSRDAIWSCFVEQDGKRYYNDSEESRWNPLVEDIMSEAMSTDKEFSDKVKIHGENMIITTKHIPELDGTYIEVISLDKLNGGLVKLNWLYAVIMVVIMLILISVIQLVVKTMVRRFYLLFGTLQEVQEGNLDVVVPDCGADELGELADQIGIMLERIKVLMKDNLDREILVKNSEIRALQNQINAHFIYNVLESVKMMAEIEEKYDIADAVTALGIMLRYSMKGLARNVTVRQEVEYIQKYVALMNLRFDYEIYLSLNIPEMLWDQEIPKMSLQPIVENAICHGIEDIAEDTNIYIKGIVLADNFIIEITDQGRGMTVQQVESLREKIEDGIEVNGGSGSGIGLKNVQDRIQIHFGKEYGIQVSSRFGCYTKVSMKIPLNQIVSLEQER